MAALADPDHVQYLGCGGDAVAACREHFERAVSSAVWSLASSFDEDEHGFADAASAVGSRSAQAELTAYYAASPDPFERIAILSALRRTNVFRPDGFPVECYRRLLDVPFIEVTLLLEAHVVVPIADREAAGHVRALATSSTASPGLRYAAAAALGHAETSRDLVTVVEAWEEEGALGYGAATRLGPALGRCGVGCVDVIERLTTSAQQWNRQTAYLAGPYLTGEAAEALVGRLAAAGTTADSVPPDERSLFLRAFGGRR